jgi:hypothetical protein
MGYGPMEADNIMYNNNNNQQPKPTTTNRQHVGTIYNTISRNSQKRIHHNSTIQIIVE